MNKTTISLLTAALAGVLNAHAIDIEELTPGTLQQRLSEYTLSDIADLRLAGSADVRDLLVISSLPSLKSLDIEGTDIVSFIPDKPLPLAEGDFPEGYLPSGIFFGKHLDSLRLPASLKSTGSHALAGNDFESIDLPSSLVSLGDYALYGCDRLTSVTAPASLSETGVYALADCGALVSADFSASSLTALPDYCFMNSPALSSVSLPSSLASLGTGTFAGCTALTSVQLPSSLRSLGEQAFTLSGLTGVELPSAVDIVGDFAFARCASLASAALPDGLTEAGDGIFFYDTALSHVDAPALKEIPDYTFAGASSVDFAGTPAFGEVESLGAYALLDNSAVNVILSPSLVRLDDGAMEGVTSLKQIDASALGDRVPALGENVFAGIEQSEVELVVDVDTRSVWEAAPQWKEFRIKELTGADSVADDSSGSVRAHFRGTALVVVAPEAIEAIDVYGASGAVLFRLSPFETQAEVETSGTDDRIYIVSVVTASGEKSVFKLIR